MCCYLLRSRPRERRARACFHRGYVEGLEKRQSLSRLHLQRAFREPSILPHQVPVGPSVYPPEPPAILIKRRQSTNFMKVQMSYIVSASTSSGKSSSKAPVGSGIGPLELPVSAVRERALSTSASALVPNFMCFHVCTPSCFPWMPKATSSGDL